MSEPAKRHKGHDPCPTTLVTWNCNGLISRCKWNAKELEKLVRETNHPDVICIQEVHLRALSSHSRGKPMKSDHIRVQESLDKIFHFYEKHWSLSESRYAGTLTLVHKRLGFEPSATNHRTAFSPKSALQLLMDKYNVRQQDLVFPNKNADGQGPKTKKKQTLLKSYFAPKVATQEQTAYGQHEHTPDGRFQFFCFDNMDLIHTYVPNNGIKEESLQRRRKWDQEMKEFLVTRLKILSKTSSNRPLLWCGDLNCVRGYRDGTHWERRRDGSVFEWWTDKARYVAASENKPPDPHRHPDDVGIPGLTPSERRRFEDMLVSGKLVDVWRELHPHGSQDKRHLHPWSRPDYTWRGHLSRRNNGYRSRYQGKGLRLDYFLLSPPSKLSSVTTCEILGYGEERRGLFCGSDHCASLLVLKQV